VDDLTSDPWVEEELVCPEYTTPTEVAIFYYKHWVWFWKHVGI